MGKGGAGRFGSANAEILGNLRRHIRARCSVDDLLLEEQKNIGAEWCSQSSTKATDQ
jgi:hypothetical protein